LHSESTFKNILLPVDSACSPILNERDQAVPFFEFWRLDWNGTRGKNRKSARSPNMRSRKFPGSLHTIILSSVLAILILSGCQKPTINFGTVFVDNNTTKIIVVDTFSAYMSTVTVDSFGTAGTGMLMIGRYKDDYTGVVTGKTYLQVSPPFNPPVISNQAGFDSMSLILRLDKYAYGDTTKSMRFVVSQLQQVINYPGLQHTFFSNDSSL
jgi:hypothetical protein